jgi:hypothetical protein
MAVARTWMKSDGVGPSSVGKTSLQDQYCSHRSTPNSRLANGLRRRWRWRSGGGRHGADRKDEEGEGGETHVGDAIGVAKGVWCSLGAVMRLLKDEAAQMVVRIETVASGRVVNDAAQRFRCCVDKDAADGKMR